MNDLQSDARASISSLQAELGKLAFRRPARGWLKTMRLALGMSASDLAKKLGVEVSTVTRIEDNEITDRIKLDTLRRFANELGCDLVYGIIPREDVDLVRQRQARALAERRINQLQQTMILENQALSDQMLQELVDQQTKGLLESGKLWRS